MKYLFSIFVFFVLFQLGVIWFILGLVCLVIWGGLEFFLLWLNRDQIKENWTTSIFIQEKEILKRYYRRSWNKRQIEPETEEEREIRKKKKEDERVEREKKGKTRKTTLF